MLVMQIIMIVIVSLMLLIGIGFLISYVINAKKVEKNNIDAYRSHRLNLMISILCIIGAIFIGVFIPFIG